jgi:hypothetical protein
MQRELIVKSASLGGNSDLTLLAPITPGLVDSLETVSHKTRIKRVLALLHAARKSAHEHAAARLISDAVERVGVIHSVRVAVLEAETRCCWLTRRPVEAYIRVLWQRVGSLLDLIFAARRLRRRGHQLRPVAGLGVQVVKPTSTARAPAARTTCCTCAGCS